MSDSSTDIDATKIIRYRTVVNDLICWPWENMPEVQPATLAGLIKYLKATCTINPEPLTPDNGFGRDGSGYVVRYGMRKQFYLPVEPTSEEFALMEKWQAEPENVLCPICAKPVSFSTRMRAEDMEQEHIATCGPCDLVFSKLTNFAWTPSDIGKAITPTTANRTAPPVRTTKKARPVYPFMAMRNAAGNYTINAEVRTDRPRAIKITNGVSEMWVPRSQVIRTNGRVIELTAFIVSRRADVVDIVPNRHLDEKDATEAKYRRENPIDIRRLPLIECKFDH